MNKRGLFAVLVLSLFVLSAFVSATPSITVTNYSSTKALVGITGAEDLYSYEIDFDYSGSSTVQQYNFLGASPNAVYGKAMRDGITSVYGSKLDANAGGINGAGNLFNISYSNGFALRYTYFIQNDTAGIYVYYNNSVSQIVDNGTGNTGSSSSSSSSGGGGGGGGESSGTTYVLELDTMAKGIEKDLSVGDAYKFSLGGNSNYVVSVKSIGSSGVILGLSSDGNISIDYGQSVKVDLNGDGAFDVLLTASKKDNGVSLFITDNVPAAEAAVSPPSNGIKDVTGANVPVNKDVTYSAPFFKKVTSAVQESVRGFFSGLWKSFANLFG